MYPPFAKNLSYQVFILQIGCYEDTLNIFLNCETINTNRASQASALLGLKTLFKSIHLFDF